MYLLHNILYGIKYLEMNITIKKARLKVESINYYVQIIL